MSAIGRSGGIGIGGGCAAGRRGTGIGGRSAAGRGGGIGIRGDIGIEARQLAIVSLLGLLGRKPGQNEDERTDQKHESSYDDAHHTASRMNARRRTSPRISAHNHVVSSTEQ